MDYRLSWKTMTPWMKTISGFLVSLAFLLVLTLFGLFFSPLVLLALLPSALGCTWAMLELANKKDWGRLGLIVFIGAIAWYNLAGEVPSIFTGRDQGSIAEAAWRLADNHHLTWSSDASQAFFALYGPGTALNFPGFAYTETGALITQFPLGYTTWLAAWVEWFGLAGYAIANTLLFILSAWTFFELSSLFVRRPLALTGTFTFGLTFLPMWMLHYTLSEHLALTLFLALSLSLIQLRRFPTHLLWYSLTGLSASLFIFTRIEGWVIFLCAMLLVGGIRSIRTVLLQAPLTRLILPLSILGFFLLRDFFINLPFYTVIGKAVLKNWQELWLLGSGIASSTSTSSQSLFDIFTSYGLISVFILGSVGLLLALWKEKRESLIVLILALPTFVYLIDGHITPDHPWMLRRYFFTLWPTFVLFTLLAWHFLEDRFPRFRSVRGTLGIMLLIFIIHYPSSRAAWQMDEHSALLPSVEQLAGRLSGHDLILIDRLATGDPFRLIAGPLGSVYGKQAVYFFNPEDLERIDGNAFERVFLLVPEAGVTRVRAQYGDRLIEREIFTFSLSTLTARQTAPTSVSRDTQAILFEIQ